MLAKVAPKSTIVAVQMLGCFIPYRFFLQNLNMFTFTYFCYKFYAEHTQAKQSVKRNLMVTMAARLSIFVRCGLAVDLAEERRECNGENKVLLCIVFVLYILLFILYVFDLKL